MNKGLYIKKKWQWTAVGDVSIPRLLSEKEYLELKNKIIAPHNLSNDKIPLLGKFIKRNKK